MSRLSVRNLPSVHVLTADQLNTYDVLSNDEVVFTADGLQAFLAGRSGRTSGPVQEAVR
jgi:large subunit ribosomal protein L4